MKLCIAITTAMVTVSTTASAWVTDVQSDTFTSSEHVIIYEESGNNILFFTCDTIGTGISVVAISQFQYADAVEAGIYAPILQYAIDGKVHVAMPVQSATLGSNADGNARVEAFYSLDESRKLVNAFKDAKTRIEVLDGVANATLNYGVYGTTAGAEALLNCLGKQGTNS